MKSIVLLLLILLGLGLQCPLHGDQEPHPSSPNVLVILTDDQGWGDLSIHGNRNLSTPHLDSIGSKGVIMDRFYVCPVCSPTRAEFLTGRYHPRGGVYSTSAGGERLNLGTTTIAEAFLEAGYKTGMFGKWHNGTQPPYHPRSRGFETFYGFTSGHWGHYFSPLLESNDQIVPGSGYINDDFTEHAMTFIKDHQERPFFCYLAFNTPHSPMQVPDTYWSRFEDKELSMRHRDPGKENLNHTRAALAMCENIDWNVGRLLKLLDQLSLAEDTIVVFFCDNGPNGNRWNGGMKGRKGSTDEGGVRSPLFIRWPGKIPAGKRMAHIASVIDLMPTLAELAGIQLQTAEPLDGMSLASWLTRPSTPFPDRLIFSHWKNKVSVRNQRFRLDHTTRLYDMWEDPTQQKDVSSQFPEISQHLSQAAEEWRTSVLKDLKAKDRPFTIGDPHHLQTLLPVRDARATGQIQRSNRFPNDAYFTEWHRTEDEIHWPVEVRRKGTYEVWLWQTTPQGESYPLLELEFQGQRLRARIDEPWDPPLLGADQDRVERQESYVKVFKPFPMGRMKLTKSTGTLRLKALELPKTGGPDIRWLEWRQVTSP